MVLRHRLGGFEMECCWVCAHCEEVSFSLECRCDLDKAEWHMDDDEGVVCTDFEEYLVFDEIGGSNV